MGFSVCSWNMGSDQQDYRAVCQSRDPLYCPDDVTLQERYQVVEPRAAQSLVGRAQVYCLQEMNSLTRPLVVKLMENGYDVYHAQMRKPFCAIVLDRKVFSDVENHSQLLDTADYALVVATHIETKRRVVFASMWVEGCNIDGVVTPKDAEAGDKYCDDVLERISALGENALYIIGADMNVNPEKWLSRFDKFTGSHFQILRTGQPTNVLPTSSVYPKRELDFLFWSDSSVSSSWKSFFCSDKPSVKIDDGDECPITLGDPESNSSDHIPIFTYVSVPK